MSRYVYFDTCALARWAEGDVTTPTLRARDGRAAVQTLLGEAETTLGLSEVTVLEYSSVLAQLWRQSEYPEHDQAWADRCLDALMGQIASGRIEIIPVPPKAAEQVMYLMKIAVRDRQIALRPWDALHLISATAWAEQLGHDVELATCDSDFDRFVNAFPYFRRFVTILMTV
jgi:predicted nucleic acid-binding protein